MKTYEIFWLLSIPMLFIGLFGNPFWTCVGGGTGFGLLVIGNIIYKKQHPNL